MALTSDIAVESGYFTGEDKRLVFTVYDAGTSQAAADAGTGTPQDISGWALSWMVKKRMTDPDAEALIAKVTGEGIELTTPDSGECVVVLGAADIEGIVGGDLYYHELKRTDVGYRSVLSQGSFVLAQAVHR